MWVDLSHILQADRGVAHVHATKQQGAKGGGREARLLLKKGSHPVDKPAEHSRPRLEESLEPPA